MRSDSLNKNEYVDWVIGLKKKIRSTQVKAAVSVNREMLYLYWEIGKSISQKSTNRIGGVP